MALWKAPWKKGRKAPCAPDPIPEWVLAQPATGLLAPEGFEVLVIAQNGLAHWVAQGEGGQQSLSPGDRCWWVRRAAWEIEFVPQPSAPRAGLRCLLVAYEGARVHVGSTLGAFLQGCTGPVEAPLLARHLMSLMAPAGLHSPLHRLPPCVSAEDLQLLQEHLLARARLVWGRNVEGLHRVLLPWPAAQATAQVLAADAAQPDAGADMPKPGVSAPQADAEHAQWPWPTVLAEDRRSCARLADGLPALSPQWRQLIAGVSPSDSARLRRLYTLLDTNDRLRSDWVPTDLLAQWGAAQAPDLAQRRQMSLQALRAERCLLQLRLNVEGHIAAPERLSTEAIEELEALMRSLDFDARRRLNGWWKELNP